MKTTRLKFFYHLGLIAITISLSAYYLFSHLMILIDHQLEKSMKYAVFIAWKSDQAQLGDMVIFEHKNRLIVKQVVAVAGDQVRVKQGSVFINNQLIIAANLQIQIAKQQAIPIQEGEIVLLANQYWVNSNHPLSVDSRFFGAIDSITARVIWRF